MQDYHTIYKLCYSDLQGKLQEEAVRHIRQEGHALYQRHARLHPHGLPGVALKVLRSLSYSLKGSYHTETSLAAIIKSGSLRCGGVAERLLSAKQKSSVLPHAGGVRHRRHIDVQWRVISCRARYSVSTQLCVSRNSGILQ